MSTKKVRTSLAPVTREYTIHLHKRIYNSPIKKRAPHALRAIRRFAASAMFTKRVVIGMDVNNYVWKQGINNVPRRIRVRISRTPGDGEDEDELWLTHVTLADVADPRGHLTKIIDEE